MIGGKNKHTREITELVSKRPENNIAAKPIRRTGIVLRT
jgi:hypothetical protein